MVKFQRSIIAVALVLIATAAQAPSLHPKGHLLQAGVTVIGPGPLEPRGVNKLADTCFGGGCPPPHLSPIRAPQDHVWV